MERYCQAKARGRQLYQGSDVMSEKFSHRAMKPQAPQQVLCQFTAKLFSDAERCVCDHQTGKCKSLSVKARYEAKAASAAARRPPPDPLGL
jgi:hypothetical protein